MNRVPVRFPTTRVPTLLCSLVLMLALVACGSSPTTAPAAVPTNAPDANATSAPASATGKKLNVVTTVAPLTNIVRNIGGDRIELHGILNGKGFVPLCVYTLIRRSVVW